MEGVMMSHCSTDDMLHGSYRTAPNAAVLAIHSAWLMTRFPLQCLTWSREVYDSASNLMQAPLAAAMRLRAIEPEASTTNMTRAPALRASFLALMSGFSTYTLRRVFCSWIAWLRLNCRGAGTARVLKSQTSKLS